MCIYKIDNNRIAIGSIENVKKKKKTKIELRYKILLSNFRQNSI